MPGGIPGTLDLRSREGKRSSALAGKAILAAATQSVDPAAAAEFRALEDWRHGYAPAFVRLTELEARSPQAALQIARDGLAAARAEAVWVTAEGDLPVTAALEVDEPQWRTESFGGESAGGRADPSVLRVPYRGSVLEGDALRRQLDDWVARGITEPTFAEAVGAVASNPQWLDLSDTTFALVGAGSQMGPLEPLLSWGARVAALDLPRAATWERIRDLAAARPGRVLAPARDGQEGADPILGGDLLSEVGPMVRWLAGIDSHLVLGNYGYAMGVLFVRLTLAFQVLTDALLEQRDDIGLAYLATPSDAFLVPPEAVEMSRARAGGLAPLAVAGRVAATLSRGRLAQPNYAGPLLGSGPRFGLVDAFIVDQGPNYALSKRLQRWGMEVAHADGLFTSVHVAPPTRTASVHVNPEMARRQDRTARLGIETFDAETVQALAAAILVHDVRNPQSPAAAGHPLAHPHESFIFAANPGGRWRIPFDINSSLPVILGAERAVEKARGALSSARARARREPPAPS